MSRGFLKYGEGDGIVFRHSLKHELAQLDTGEVIPYTGITYQGPGVMPTFDPVKGMLAKGSNGSVSNIRLGTPTAGLPQNLWEGGQLCFEISKEWLAMYDDNSDRGTKGYQPPATEYAFRGETTGTVTYCWMTKLNNGGCQAMIGPNANQKNSYSFAMQDMIPAAGTFNKINTVGKGEFVTVNLAWTGGENGGLFYMGVDGLVWTGNYRAKDAATTGKMFEWLFLGGLGGGSCIGTSSSNPVYMRNFQISTDIPVWETPRLFQHVYVLSDSIFDVADLNALVYDAAAAFTLRKYFNVRGMKFGSFTVSENAGYTVSTLGTQLKTKLNLLLDAQPSLVILNGGTNDLGSASWPGNFVAEYKDLLEQIFFGAAKTGRTPTQMVIMNSPPPRGAPVDLRETQHAECRKEINALVTWWDATYPSLAGRVVYNDVFQAMGGFHNPPVGILQDGIHFAYQGNNDFGEIIAKKIHEVMGRV